MKQSQTVDGGPSRSAPRCHHPPSRSASTPTAPPPCSDWAAPAAGRQPPPRQGQQRLCPKRQAERKQHVQQCTAVPPHARQLTAAPAGMRACPQLLRVSAVRAGGRAVRRRPASEALEWLAGGPGAQPTLAVRPHPPGSCSCPGGTLGGVWGASAGLSCTDVVLMAGVIARSRVQQLHSCAPGRADRPSRGPAAAFTTRARGDAPAGQAKQGQQARGCRTLQQPPFDSIECSCFSFRPRPCAVLQHRGGSGALPAGGKR